jgi:DNA-binding XRE family transcriptional regulator
LKCHCIYPKARVAKVEAETHHFSINTIFMNLPQKLKLIRSVKNWTQEEVAEKLGISIHTYAKIARVARVGWVGAKRKPTISQLILTPTIVQGASIKKRWVSLSLYPPYNLTSATTI